MLIAAFPLAFRLMDAAEYVVSEDDRVALAAWHFRSNEPPSSPALGRHVHFLKPPLCVLGGRCCLPCSSPPFALRLMDAAEYVVSEDDRMALAALALDSLSDAVSNESILHFIATLDTEAELQLIISTGGGTATNFLGNGFSFMPILIKSSLCHATVMQCQSGQFRLYVLIAPCASLISVLANNPRCGVMTTVSPHAPRLTSTTFGMFMFMQAKRCWKCFCQTLRSWASTSAAC